jgi:hypothetical protein
MPISSTVILINKSASNSSKYAAKSSLNFSHFIIQYFSKKASRGGAQDLQDLQGLQGLQDLQGLQGLTPQKNTICNVNGVNKCRFRHNGRSKI